MAVGDLTTLDNVEGFLGLTVGANPPIDTLLTRLISAVSAYMQTAMSRTIAQTTYNETRNGMGNTRMALKNTPIISIATLAVDGVSIALRAPLSQSSTASPGGYTFDQTTIMLSNGYSFTRGYQNVQVTYDAGFATTPYDVEQACVDTVCDWFKYRDRIGKISEAIDQQTITFTNSDFPARARGVINFYNTKSPVY